MGIGLDTIRCDVCGKLLGFVTPDLFRSPQYLDRDDIHWHAEFLLRDMLARTEYVCCDDCEELMALIIASANDTADMRPQDTRETLALQHAHRTTTVRQFINDVLSLLRNSRGLRDEAHSS